MEKYRIKKSFMFRGTRFVEEDIVVLKVKNERIHAYLIYFDSVKPQIECLGKASIDFLYELNKHAVVGGVV